MNTSPEMSELFKIVLTSSLTVFGGIVVFVAGQLIAKFFIEPIHEQRRLVGEIEYSLIFYANLYSNPGLGKPEEMDKASDMLRQQGSQLLARTRAITWYGVWQFFNIVPKHADVRDAAASLIGLSNSIHRDSGASGGQAEVVRQRLRLIP